MIRSLRFEHFLNRMNLIVPSWFLEFSLGQLRSLQRLWRSNQFRLYIGVFLHTDDLHTPVVI
jgi:hypothetical protein